MTLYAGIDGGGSRTRAILLDPTTGVSAKGEAGASNPNSVGAAAAVEHVMTALSHALAILGKPRSEVGAMVAALAGVGRPETADAVRNLLSRHLPSAWVDVVPDALAALAGGSNAEPGSVLVVGTGSVAFAEGAGRRIVRSGGYGYLIGDEGSGFAIGRHGLRAVMQAYDGRGPETALTETACRRLDCARVPDIVERVYGVEHPVGAVAAFAASVVKLRHQDEVAGAIVRRAQAAHVRLVESVRRQLGRDATPTVVVTGGLYEGDPSLLVGLTAALPECSCRLPQHSAVEGAALLAMRAGRERLSAEDVARWREIVGGEAP